MKAGLKNWAQKILHAMPVSPTWLFTWVLNFARASNKGFRIFPKSFVFKNGSSRLAVKSSLGFWYCGDISNSYDVAWVIFRKGLVEPEGTALVKFFLSYFGAQKVQTVIYDIGANTGYYSLLAAFVGGNKAMVYGFEPVAEFYKTAQESVALNRLEKNCRILNCALGDTDKQSDIFVDGTGSTLNISFKTESGDQAAAATNEQSFFHVAKDHPALEKVKQVKLDSLSKAGELQDPDFIKMDVEGFEYQVLLGGQQTLARCLPVIYFEAFYKKKAGSFSSVHSAQIQKFLENLGYEIFVCEADKLIPAKNFKLASVSSSASQTVRMNLAFHAKKHAALIQRLPLEYASLIARS